MEEAIEVVSKISRKSIPRREYELRVKHTGRGIPSRSELRELLIPKLREKPDTTVIVKILGETGLQESRVIVHAYDSKSTMELFEPEHILRKNFQVGGKEEGGEGDEG
uniref:30S ribosomal protein S24e n=1 Tax=uncultured korarchaeote TaxID=161241 RepID=A0A1L2JM09_9CREN|nr:ribosomal protein S24E [uncultured korarchaeote]